MKCWLVFVLVALLAGSNAGAAPVGKSAKPPAKKAEPKPVAAKAPLVGEYVSFPSVGVKLRRPSGMVRSETWTGFEQEDSRCSLMVVKVAGPYAAVSSGFTPENMKPRGMTLESKVEQPVEGLAGVLVFFTMTAGGTKWDKWALVFGEATQTYIITGNFPSELRSRWTERIKASLASTRLDAEAPGGELGFAVTASPKLKATAAISDMLCYTIDGMLPAKSPEAPFFVAAPSLTKTPVLDPRRFSEERLRGSVETRVTSITSHEPVTIDGLEGYESVAEATDAKSGTPIVLYQVMLFDGGRYYLMQGLVGTALREEYLPEFKTMARSFKRKPQGAAK